MPLRRVSVPPGEAERVGICFACVHARRVVSDRGSRFYRCGLADVDAGFCRYPRLPVRSCRGYLPDPRGPERNLDRPGIPRRGEGE